MELIFSTNHANYRSFNFDFKRSSKEYEAFFGVCLANVGSEFKRNANTIVEHIAKIDEPKSAFKVDGGLSVDFNNETRVNLGFIISDFVNKLKYKKYKTLARWIPLLQDHFWNNSEKFKVLPKKRGKRIGLIKPSFVAGTGNKYIPTWKKGTGPVEEFLPDDYDGNELPEEHPELIEPPRQVLTQAEFEHSLASGRGIQDLIRDHEIAVQKKMQDYKTFKMRQALGLRQAVTFQPTTAIFDSSSTGATYTIPTSSNQTTEDNNLQF